MKPHGDLIFERRRGGIALRWDLHSWGVGIDVGAYRDDWLLAKDDEYYWTTWATFKLGPFNIEFSFNGPGRKWPLPKFKRFGALKIGTVFEISENMEAIKITYSSGLTNKGKYVYYRNDDMVQTWDYIWEG